MSQSQRQPSLGALIKRSVSTRVVAASAAIGLAITGAASCTVASPPYKISSTWIGLTLGSPGGGINAGEFATLLYTTSNAPKGSRIVLQQGVKSGKTTSWIQRGVPSTLLDGIMSVQPPFGRDLYRLVIKDSHGKVLASTSHTIDAYGLFTFGALAGRTTQTGTSRVNGASFTYYFNDAIAFARTSCRQLTDLKVYNTGATTRQLKITHTTGRKATTQTVTVAARGQLRVGPVAVTPGESLSLHVDDNVTLGKTLDVFGEAYCFTANGRY